MVSQNHWPCVLTNLETGVGLYKDSIGREVPRDFEDTFSNFFKQYAKHTKKTMTLLNLCKLLTKSNQQKALTNVDIFV